MPNGKCEIIKKIENVNEDILHRQAALGLPIIWDTLGLPGSVQMHSFIADCIPASLHLAKTYAPAFIDDAVESRDDI